MVFLTLLNCVQYSQTGEICSCRFSVIRKLVVSSRRVPHSPHHSCSLPNWAWHYLTIFLKSTPEVCLCEGTGLFWWKKKLIGYLFAKLFMFIWVLLDSYDKKRKRELRARMDYCTAWWRGEQVENGLWLAVRFGVNIPGMLLKSRKDTWKMKDFSTFFCCFIAMFPLGNIWLTLQCVWD